MTRIVGRVIQKAPCCGALFCTHSYASINYSAREHWSDGRNVGSLAPQGLGLRRCACGAFFLIRQCEEVGKLPRAREPAPDGWETMAAPEGEPGDDSRQWFMGRYDTRPASERASEPPFLKDLTGEEAAIAIALDLPDREVTIAARHLYWQHLNDPFREVYRAHKSEHPDSLPEFSPTPEQRANMEALVALLDGAEDADYDDVAELYRELGDFDRADLAIRKVVPNRWFESIAPMQRRLIGQRIAAPVRYRW